MASVQQLQRGFAGIRRSENHTPQIPHEAGELCSYRGKEAAQE